MKNDDFNAPAAPSSYEEAEAILQRLSRTDIDAFWAELTRDEGEKLLKNLAPGSREDLRAPAIPAHSMTNAAPASSAPADDLPDSPDEPPVLPKLSEATLLDVLETAPDGVVVIDRRGTIVLVNKQTETMFGYSREELIGKKVEILVPIRHQRAHVAQRHSYFDKPRIRAMGQMDRPLFGLHKDGREFPVEISLSPLPTENGILVTSTIRDVTERKLHLAERQMREAQLAKAEERYRTLIEQIPAVTFIAPFDESSGELYVSPQIENMLGFTQEEWLNDPVLWYRQLHPEDMERWHREFARTCATHQPFSSVYRFRARDGRTVWVRGEAKVVRDKSGQPIFLQGVAFDITKLKEAEEEMKQLNRTLNDRVAARTEELKRSNDELANIGYYMAHEMKKPIGRINDIINGPLTKSNRPDPPEVRFEQIQRVAGDAEKLVMGLLRYALATDKANKFMRTDCASLVREVHEELRHDLETVGATLTANFLPVVIADRASLKTVFFNLIENAIKYRSERPLMITVFAEEIENSESPWVFSVSDNGMGIPKHPDLPPPYAAAHNYHEKVFEMGTKSRINLKNAEGEEIRGHGIGLSHCKKVIEYHGGKIWVESEAGKGSTFFFTLPAIPEAESLTGK
jgi:PAS domain S-box-containing protein